MFFFNYKIFLDTKHCKCDPGFYGDGISSCLSLKEFLCKDKCSVFSNCEILENSEQKVAKCKCKNGFIGM